MSLRVGATQPIGGHMGVQLGRREGRVAEDLLYGPQIRSAFEQVGGGGVAQAVRAEVRGSVDVREPGVNQSPDRPLIDAPPP